MKILELNPLIYINGYNCLAVHDSALSGIFESVAKATDFLKNVQGSDPVQIEVHIDSQPVFARFSRTNGWEISSFSSKEEEILYQAFLNAWYKKQ